MKRNLALLLALLLMLSATGLAEIVGGTGTRPTASQWDTYLINASIVPFAPLQWGMTQEEVAAATDAQPTGAEDRLQSTIAIPGIEGEAIVNYIFTPAGLDKVLVFTRDAVNTAVDFLTLPAGAVLQDKANQFFETGSPDAHKTNAQNPPLYNTFLCTVSDIAAGYIELDGSYHLGIGFYRPAVFSESLIRNSDRYFLTLDATGDTLYVTPAEKMNGFDTDYTRDPDRMHTFCAFFSKIQVVMSRVSDMNVVPQFAFGFNYAGQVLPKNVDRFGFQVDGVYYEFNPKTTTKASVTQYNEYQQQFWFVIGQENAPFMNALTNTSGTVNVQIFGDGFSLRFDMPQASRQQLADDWRLFRQANGHAPFFLLMNRPFEKPCRIR